MFTPGQLHALAFFGLYSVLLGYLMIRSSLVPRAVGACLVVSGVAAMLLPYNLTVGLSGEAVIILWLLVIGVNAQPARSARPTLP